MRSYLAFAAGLSAGCALGHISKAVNGPGIFDGFGLFVSLFGFAFYAVMWLGIHNKKINL